MMLYTATLIVKEQDLEFENLGVDKSEIKYYPVQFFVEDVDMHHGYEHKTDDGQVLDACVVMFTDGMQISILEPFEKLEKARKEYPYPENR